MSATADQLITARAAVPSAISTTRRDEPDCCSRPSVEALASATIGASLRQFLAELHAPLVERVDVPDRRLRRRPCARRARSGGPACGGRAARRGRSRTAGCRETPCGAPAPRPRRPDMPCSRSCASTSRASRPAHQRLALREAIGDEQRRDDARRRQSARRRPGNRPARHRCPDAAAGRTRAGRWCPARPRRPGRSRTRPACRRGARDLPLLSISSCWR